MGGKSSSSSSKSTTSLGNTTTKNPYVTSTTTNKGTVSDFVNGSALDVINDFVNDNMYSMLNDYLQPNLNSATNQALLNSFSKNLASQANTTLENNIINPLSKRNMIRSSQATDMYNNMQASINDSIADYVNNLLVTSQENSAAMLNNLMKLYLNGYNVIASNQAQSLNTSQSNATKKTKSNTQSSNYSPSLLDLSSLVPSDTITLAKSLGISL